MPLQKYSWYGWWPSNDNKDSFCSHEEGPSPFTIWCIAESVKEARKMLVSVFLFMERTIIPVDKCDTVRIKQLDKQLQENWQEQTAMEIVALRKKMCDLFASNDDARHFFDVYGIEADADEARIGCIGHNEELDFSNYTLNTVILEHADAVVDPNMTFYTLLLNDPVCEEC